MRSAKKIGSLKIKKLKKRLKKWFIKIKKIGLLKIKNLNLIFRCLKNTIN